MNYQAGMTIFDSRMKFVVADASGKETYTFTSSSKLEVFKYVYNRRVQSTDVTIVLTISITISRVPEKTVVCQKLLCCFFVVSSWE